MRFNEFNLTEQELLEVKMSASSLSKQVSNINAIAGVEFEMYVPSNGDGGDSSGDELDMDQDEYIDSFDDIIRFYSQGDMSEQSVREEIQSLIDEYWEDIAEAIQKKFKENMDIKEIVTDYITEKYGEDDENLETLIADALDEEDYNSDYEAALEAYEEENYDSFRDIKENDYGYDDEKRFLKYNGFETMGDLLTRFDLYWPFYKSETGNVNIETVAEDFRDVVSSNVKVNTSYHGSKKDGVSYYIEPDSSVDDPDDEGDAGLEFVSPPLPLSKMLQDMKNIIEWANDYGCYTNTACGLHMNVSIEDVDHSQLDYVKLALFVGDNYILDQFSRYGNTYAKSILKELDNEAFYQGVVSMADILTKLKKGLTNEASKVIHNGITEKYAGLNSHGNYMEFRYAGNDWLNIDFDHLARFLMRYAYAYSIACDPEKEKQEYIKKLYKLLTESGNKNMLDGVVSYLSGETNDAKIQNSFKKSTLNRKITAKLPNWEVSFDTNVHDVNTVRQQNIKNTYNHKMAPVKVFAKNAEDAIKMAREKWNLYDRNSYPNFYFKAHMIG